MDDPDFGESVRKTASADHRISNNALEDLKHARLHLYDVFMQAPASVAVLRGPSHIFEIANPLYRQLVGTDREIIGKPVSEALSEIRSQGFIEILDEVYNTGRPFSGNEVKVSLDRNADGNMRDVFLNFVYQPITDSTGQVNGIFVHAVEVTEQVKARKKIQENEEKYRTLFSTMDQGFCIVDVIFDNQGTAVDYRFLETNPVFEKQTGLKNAAGKTARSLVPDLEQRWFFIYGKVASSGDAVRFIEKSDAMGRWFEVYAFRLGNEQSRKIAILFTDISERKKTEEQLNNAMIELERRVTERTNDLNKANVALLKSNDDLLQFAHVASHDLKEPLRKIQLFVSRLKAEDEHNFSENGTKYINKIQDASSRMVKMIEGILNYSAIESNSKEIQHIDLNKVMGDIRTDLEALIEQKNAVITYQQLPEVEGEPLLIFQLFYNLIINALKYSKPEEPNVITVTRSIITRDGKDYVYLIIKDHGMGFDPLYAEKIFLNFLRLHAKDGCEGTGLGLSLCKKVVDRHNGKIWAVGELNQGAEFHVQLPLLAG